MSRIITKRVYEYGELLERAASAPTPEARQRRQRRQRAAAKARRWLVEAVDDRWYEDSEQEWKEILKAIGFTAPDIQFSGFWSQGDGASFSAKHVDVERMVIFLSNPGEAEDPELQDLHSRQPGLFPSPHPEYRRLLRLVDYIELEVDRFSSHYSHERTCRVTGDLRDKGDYLAGLEWKSRTPKVRALYQAFLEDVEVLRLALCRAMYDQLENEYEGLTCDETLVEVSKDGEIFFDELGRVDG